MLTLPFIDHVSFLPFIGSLFFSNCFNSSGNSNDFGVDVIKLTLSVCYLPSTVLSTLYHLSLLTLTGETFYYPDIIGNESETQRG